MLPCEIPKFNRLRPASRRIPLQSQSRNVGRGAENDHLQRVGRDVGALARYSGRQKSLRARGSLRHRLRL